MYLRVLINLLPDATNYFSPLILTVAIISLIYASFSTIIQQDNKRLIAYSSVAHMAVVVLGLFSNNLQGIEGAILLAIGHGFTSPALFICVGGIIYDRTGTRIINYIRGLATYMPLFSIFFFIFTLCNTGIPLSINWAGEQLSLMGIWQQNPIIACLGSTGIVLSACYSIFLYNRISYGNLSPYLPPLKDLNRREYYMLFSLLIPTFVFGILPNVLLNPLHISVTSLLYVLPSMPPLDFTNLGSIDLVMLQQETIINTSIWGFFSVKNLKLYKKLKNKTELDNTIEIENANADKNKNNKDLIIGLLIGIVLRLAIPTLIKIMTDVNIYDQALITDSIYLNYLICAIIISVFVSILTIFGLLNINRLILSIKNKPMWWATIIVTGVCDDVGDTLGDTEPKGDNETTKETFKLDSRRGDPEMEENEATSKSKPSYMFNKNRWDELSNKEISLSAEFYAEEEEMNNRGTSNPSEEKGIPIPKPKK